MTDRKPIGYAAPAMPRRGPPRFGWALADGQWVPVDEEQAAIRRVAELAREGKGYRAIARTLNAEGHPTREGKRWHRSLVAKILRDSLNRVTPVTPPAPHSPREALAIALALRRAGFGLRPISARLNAAGIPTATGAPWGPVTVSRLLRRAPALPHASAPGYALRKVGQGSRRARLLPRRPLTAEEARETRKALRRAPPRPKTRADCQGRPGFCPWLSCKHNLAIEVDARGFASLTFPDPDGGLDVDAMLETCALDIADRGGVDLEEIGAALGISKVAAFFLERRALAKLRAAGVDLRAFLEER